MGDSTKVLKKTRFFVDSSSNRHIGISLLNAVMHSVVWIAKHTVLVWSAARSLVCCSNAKSYFAFLSCASLKITAALFTVTSLLFENAKYVFEILSCNELSHGVHGMQHGSWFAWPTVNAKPRLDSCNIHVQYLLAIFALNAIFTAAKWAWIQISANLNISLWLNLDNGLKALILWEDIRTFS